MNADLKKHLLERMSETHAAILAIIGDVDLELRVYQDTDWRIRDILGHIATWDREVSRSLRAFLDGTEYLIPGVDGDETEYNQQAVREHRNLSTQQIVAEFNQARMDFKAALSDIPTDRFPGDLLYPWGDERGDIATLVDYMIGHDEEHCLEIEKSLQAAQAD